MKIRYIIALIFASAELYSGQVSAAIIASDNFEDYTSGSNIDAQNSGSGFTGAWSAVGNHSTVQTNSLEVLASSVSGGSQALRLQPTSDLGDTGSFLSRGFSATTETLYLSLIVRKEVMDGSDFINFMVSNGETGDTVAAMGFGLRNAANNPFFVRVGRSGSGQTTNSSQNSTLDTSFLLLAKFSKDGSADYNRTDLFINPLSTTEPGIADATAISGVTGIDTLSLFNVRHFNPEEGDRIFIDRMILATTFEEALTGGVVVPEPTSSALLGIAASLCLLRRRRK